MGFNVIVDIGVRFMSLFIEMVLMIKVQMYLFLHSQKTEYPLIYYKQYAFQIWWTLNILLFIIFLSFASNPSISYAYNSLQFITIN